MGLRIGADSSAEPGLRNMRGDKSPTGESTGGPLSIDRGEFTAGDPGDCGGVEAKTGARPGPPNSRREAGLCNVLEPSIDWLSSEAARLLSRRSPSQFESHHGFGEAPVLREDTISSLLKGVTRLEILDCDKAGGTSELNEESDGKEVRDSDSRVDIKGELPEIGGGEEGEGPSPSDPTVPLLSSPGMNMWLPSQRSKYQGL